MVENNQKLTKIPLRITESLTFTNLEKILNVTKLTILSVESETKTKPVMNKLTIMTPKPNTFTMHESIPSLTKIHIRTG